MKKLAIVLSFLLQLPANADSGFKSQTNPELTNLNQLRQVVLDKIKKNQEQLQQINQGLDQLKVENDGISNSLFGNSALSGPSGVSFSNTTVSNSPVPSVGRSLKGAVSSLVVGDLLASLTKQALAGNAVNERVTHFEASIQKALAYSKDAFNYVIPYRGFGPSSEAGDVITDEKLKIHDLASAKYAQQKIGDDIHSSLTAALFEVAMGIGNNNQEQISAGKDQIKNLVGKDIPIEDTLNVQVEMPETIDWDVLEKSNQEQDLIKKVIDKDPVISDILAAVHKYNHRSKGSMVASHIIMPALGAMSLAPSLAGPAAKGALLTYVMLTGGPEESKLLKELYLDKRLESRIQLIHDEVHLVIDNYQLSILTKNSSLYFLSQSLMNEMNK